VVETDLQVGFDFVDSSRRKDSSIKPSTPVELQLKLRKEKSMISDKEAPAKTKIELEPYLLFSGNCEEALKFYQSIFGGEITSVSRYKEMPHEHASEFPAEYADKIMHANFKSPSFSFMASDSRPGKQYGEGPISLSLGLHDVDLAQKLFDGLAQGGNVEMPMADTFWGAKFGMLTDKFGIDWMINCQLEQQ